jgi:Bacterial Ig-like domain
MINKFKFTKVISAVSIMSLMLVSVSSAQTSFNSASNFCPYTFQKNLSQGINDSEVKVLQQILNTDQRTQIALNSIASPGNETSYFGPSTKEAVKKFQALFIEYIGIANGNFGPKTRTVMNAVCNGEAFVNQSGSTSVNSPYTGVSTQNTANNNAGTTASGTDTVSPSIYLRSNSTVIEKGQSFRLIVTASEPIKAFTQESIIIENGSVSDLRKLTPNSYSLLVTPNDNAKVVIAQIEADRVADLADNLNQNASNEVRISINQQVAEVATSTASTSGVAASDLDSIFQKILASVSPTPAPAVTSTDKKCPNSSTNYPDCDNRNRDGYRNDDYRGNNNGGGQGGGQGQQGGGIMGMLSSLLGRGGQGQPNVANNNSDINNAPKDPAQLPTPPDLDPKGDKPKPEPTPADPKPSDRPESGEVQERVIPCEGILSDEGKLKGRCDDTHQIYTMKSVDGKDTPFVLIYKGKGKVTLPTKPAGQEDPTVVPTEDKKDLSKGDTYKYSKTNINALTGYKICETIFYDGTRYICKKESSKTQGKKVFEFIDESKVTWAKLQGAEVNKKDLDAEASKSVPSDDAKSNLGRPEKNDVPTVRYADDSKNQVVRDSAKNATGCRNNNGSIALSFYGESYCYYYPYPNKGDIYQVKNSDCIKAGYVAYDNYCYSF